MGAWRKSSYSNGNGGQCVEVGSGTDAVLVRDTKQARLDDARTTLAVTPDAWRRFVSKIKLYICHRVSGSQNVVSRLLAFAVR